MLLLEGFDALLLLFVGLFFLKFEVRVGNFGALRGNFSDWGGLVDLVLF